jgi:AraC-like DNA-binding protein
MATGVFHTARSGQSLQYRARVRRDRALARFAEELSTNPGSLIDVARALGISYSAAQAQLARLRRDLGVPVRDPKLPRWRDMIESESLHHGSESR